MINESQQVCNCSVTGGLASDHSVWTGEWKVHESIVRRAAGCDTLGARVHSGAAPDNVRSLCFQGAWI